MALALCLCAGCMCLTATWRWLSPGPHHPAHPGAGQVRPAYARCKLPDVTQRTPGWQVLRGGLLCRQRTQCQLSELLVNKQPCWWYEFVMCFRPETTITCAGADAGLLACRQPPCQHRRQAPAAGPQVPAGHQQPAAARQRAAQDRVGHRHGHQRRQRQQDRAEHDQGATQGG